LAFKGMPRLPQERHGRIADGRVPGARWLPEARAPAVCARRLSRPDAGDRAAPACFLKKKQKTLLRGNPGAVTARLRTFFFEKKNQKTFFLFWSAVPFRRA
jgi:hypothetical protein